MQVSEKSGLVLYGEMVKWLKRRLLNDLSDDPRISNIIEYLETLTRITSYSEAYLNRTWSAISNMAKNNDLFIMRLTCEMMRDCINGSDEYELVCDHISFAEGIHHISGTVIGDMYKRLPSKDYMNDTLKNNPWVLFLITLEDSVRTI